MITPTLYGLVLCGGQSSRMGEDKGSLNYHSLPQAQFCQQLLAPYCEQVFISCREDQLHLPAYRGLPVILDQQAHKGPMMGVLSAFRTNPQVAWLVLACDMPFITEEDVASLIAHRNPQQMATAFYNPDANRFEPLFALYEPAIFSIMEASSKTRASLAHLLWEQGATGIPIDDNRTFQNVNTEEDYRAILSRIDAPQT